MSYTQKETLSITSCYGCGDTIPANSNYCSKCRYELTGIRDDFDDLPDNLDDYCDDCGHAAGRCKCNRHLDLLAEQIEQYQSWDRPSVPIRFSKVQAVSWWEGYSIGAGLDWDTREAGRRMVQAMED